METIFDHNVTGVEIELLNSFIVSKGIRDKENYENNLDRDRGYSDLYHLYTLRGEVKKAEQYFKKIQNPEYKSTLSVF